MGVKRSLEVTLATPLQTEKRLSEAQKFGRKAMRIVGCTSDEGLGAEGEVNFNLPPKVCKFVNLRFY